ncbi:DUF397 domain-containing protein [Dactylosporangium fulvum]|uniref:DUF397 domain-containing protein n=2 Tax=Dactylosporangium fulvum TaxID=53359 RepID=A0ABY5WDV7_9ACTN|nr:DUF397 domain-containing protein [Dactylosporangium fulvum]
MASPVELRWRRSAKCGSSACVEVATTGGRVLVRDAKNSSGPHLSFCAEDWKAFVAEVRAGRLGDS